MATPTILVVDDEETVRGYIRRILGMRGFQVLEAADGLDALRQIQSPGTTVDLLLTDIRMPRMDGIELAHAVTSLHPRMPVLYISGYPFDIEQERTQHAYKACGFLAKPFTPKVLVDTVNQCLSSVEKASCA